MIDRPALWLIAGPNGAGKSTFTQRCPISEFLKQSQIKDSPDLILDPDACTRQFLEDQGFKDPWKSSFDDQKKAFLEVARQIYEQAAECIDRSGWVLIETVLSTDKYLPLVDLVHKRGGSFCLIYVALKSPELSVARVSSRVAVGGHDVPRDRIVQRWHGSIRNLGVFASRADCFFVFDNSDSNPALRPPLLAKGNGTSASILHPDRIPAITSILEPLTRSRREQ